MQGGEQGAYRRTQMAKPGKPNILFIMADDIGWFNVSCNNNGLMGYRTGECVAQKWSLVGPVLPPGELGPPHRERHKLFGDVHRPALAAREGRRARVHVLLFRALGL